MLNLNDLIVLQTKVVPHFIFNQDTQFERVETLLLWAWKKKRLCRLDSIRKTRRYREGSDDEPEMEDPPDGGVDEN